MDGSIIFGGSASNPHEYATAEEAVSARVRLGILRGFLDHQGLDMSSAICACRQVAEFCAGRSGFYPVFPIAPWQFFREGVEAEMAGLADRHPQALFRLCSDEREGDFRTVVRFLAALPGERAKVLVIPEAQWPSLATLLDAAARHPNLRFVHAAMREAETILTDTSLLHLKGDIALFSDRYSSKRILFTLGYRALGGAALGGVLTSGLSRDEKTDILHGNRGKKR